MKKTALMITTFVAIAPMMASADAYAQKKTRRDDVVFTYLIDNNLSFTRLADLKGLDGLKNLDDLKRLKGLKGLDGLKGLEGLKGLAGRQGLSGLSGLASIGHGFSGYTGYSTSNSFRSKAPEAWQEQDPAVALYRQARSELNDSRFERAAELFARIRERYPKSTYAADAYYWQAFALYKNGDNEAARDIVKEQIAKYPKAATAGDARSLLARLNGIIVSTTGDPETGEKVKRDAIKATQGCPTDDDDDDVRIAALNAVLNMSSQQAMPLLKQILAKRDACSATLRRKAVFLVSQKRGPEVEDILLGAARNDPDKEVRSQAVFWLSQVNTEKAVAMLEDILKTSNDSEVRDKAIFALSQHNSARASQILRDFALNGNAPDELREKAIFWIGQRRGEDNANFLKNLFGKEKNPELRDKIIFSLSQQRGNESWLMTQALNEGESIEMRKKALFWAGQSKSTSLAELTALYDKIQNREMKDQLIFVYSQRRETAAVDKMMDIAKNEKDRELRKKALFWLGQSKDPRVAEFLMQLINQ